MQDRPAQKGKKSVTRRKGKKVMLFWLLLCFPVLLCACNQAVTSGAFRPEWNTDGLENYVAQGPGSPFSTMDDAANDISYYIDAF
jgi:hypothetical protein